MKTTTNLRTLNCAIYTRKSTEEGLEQEFNTLDAQRESAECYIKSQEAEGWVCLPEHYDDGGFTGGNMERPALKRLLAQLPQQLALGVEKDWICDSFSHYISFVRIRVGNRKPSMSSRIF